MNFISIDYTHAFKSKIAIKNTNLVKWQNFKWSGSTLEKMKPVLSSQPYMGGVEILCKTPVSAFQHDKGCCCAFITLLTVYCGIIFNLCHCANKDGLITLIYTLWLHTLRFCWILLSKLWLMSHMWLFGPLSVALPQNTIAWVSLFWRSVVRRSLSFKKVALKRNFNCCTVDI